MKGFVYVVGVENSPVKVGSALDAHIRLSQLQMGCPDELTLHYAVPVRVNLYVQVERAAHRALKARHRRGEWFNVDADDAYAAVLSARDELIREADLDATYINDPLARTDLEFGLPPGHEQALARYASALRSGDQLAVAAAQSRVVEAAGQVGLNVLRLLALKEHSDVLLRQFLGNDVAGRNARRTLAEAVDALMGISKSPLALPGKSAA